MSSRGGERWREKERESQVKVAGFCWWKRERKKAKCTALVEVKLQGIAGRKST